MYLVFPFFQAWLPEPEQKFHPATAEISFGGSVMILSATMTQQSVTTHATTHQQRLWELGDVVELFIQRVGCEDYYEYQIAPNSLMLALHYPDREAVAAVRNGRQSIEEYLCPFPEGTATITPTGWVASLSIPIGVGQHRINCGRYDYSLGKAPIVSSIAPLTKRDFHEVENWPLIESP